MKRIISLAVAAIFSVCFASPAKAASNLTPVADKGSITVDGTRSGMKYDIYRVFDLKYGTTELNGNAAKHYSYTITEAFKAFFDAKGFTNRDDAVKYVYAQNSPDAIKAFSEEVKAYALNLEQTNKALVDAVRLQQTATGEKVEFKDIPLGYYLLYPEGSVNGICNLTTNEPDAEISLKAEYPSVKKEIDENGGQSAGAYSLGDEVPYKLTSKVPDMTGYASYTFILKDVMSKGLTFNAASLEVRVDGVLKTAGTDYTLTDDANADGSHTIKAEFVNFIQYKALKGSEIVATYTATVNKNAVTGQAGNSNAASIIFSNNPTANGNAGDTDEVETPNDTTKVYVFELSMLKTVGDDHNKGALLANAEFALWTTKAPKNTAGVETMSYDGKTLYLLDKTLKSDENGKFSHKIGAATFYLFETKAPAGFNLLADPIVFTVEAVINQAKELTGITIDNAVLAVSDLVNGIISGAVENMSDGNGITLPGTGGMGTRIFMMGGGLLMIGSVAGMLLFNNKKGRKAVEAK